MLGAGPALFLLLPHVSRVELAPWLGQFGLSGRTLGLMVPYFGLVHPAIEQLHWSPLREQTRHSHLVFVGYHGLILYSLLRAPWLAVCATLLAGASVVWLVVSRRSGGWVGPAACHMAADLGVITAVRLAVSGG